MKKQEITIGYYNCTGENIDELIKEYVYYSWYVSKKQKLYTLGALVSFSICSLNSIKRRLMGIYGRSWITLLSLVITIIIISLIVSEYNDNQHRLRRRFKKYKTTRYYLDKHSIKGVIAPKELLSEMIKRTYDKHDYFRGLVVIKANDKEITEWKYETYTYNKEEILRELHQKHY